MKRIRYMHGLGDFRIVTEEELEQWLELTAVTQVSKDLRLGC